MFSCLDILQFGYSHCWASGGGGHPERVAEMPAKGAAGREEILQPTVNTGLLVPARDL